jgi:hypothetical protein
LFAQSSSGTKNYTEFNVASFLQKEKDGRKKIQHILLIVHFRIKEKMNEEIFCCEIKDFD